MIKRFSLLVFFVLLPSFLFAAGPRSWGKSGTATTTTAKLTVGGAATPFGPTLFCVENLDEAINIFIDFTDGIAATVDDSTNIKILPAKSYCFSFDNPDVMNKVEIGIISASGTPAYNAFAMAKR